MAALRRCRPGRQLHPEGDLRRQRCGRIPITTKFRTPWRNWTSALKNGGVVGLSC